MSGILKKAILTLTAVQFIAIIFISLNNKIYSWDEAAYLLNGMDIAGKNIAPVLQQYIAHERHPMLSWIIGLLLHLNMPFLLLNLLSPLALVLLYALVLKMGKCLFSEEVGILSGFLLLSTPIVIGASTKILTDIPGSLLFTLCLFLYYQGLKKPKYFLWGGLIAGASILMRDSNLLLLPILLVFGALFYRQINLKYFLISAPIAFAATLPYFVDNYLRFGNPLSRILFHIKMVNEGTGYCSIIQKLPSHQHLLIFQVISNLRLLNDGVTAHKDPCLWIVYLPVFVSLPLFFLFILHLCKQKNNILADPVLKFLTLSSALPFLFFVFRQKMDPRLTLIILVPILLIGVKELLSMGARMRLLFIAGILIFNNFPLTDLTAYQNISLTPSHQECFDFIKSHTPGDALIYSNAVPPSSIAWYANRSIKYSVKPDDVIGLRYYLDDLSIYCSKVPINADNYILIFKNDRFLFYKRIT